MNDGIKQTRLLAELHGDAEPGCLRETGGGCRTAAAAMVCAVHEAGHAVAAQSYGAENVKAWISDDGERGRCTWDSSMAFSRIERLVICMAGPEAERTYTNSNDREFWKWRDVIETQRELGRFIFAADDWLFNAAYSEAAGLVAARWLTIRRHAFTLAKFKTLTL